MNNNDYLKQEEYLDSPKKQKGNLSDLLIPFLILFPFTIILTLVQYLSLITHL